MEITSLLGGLLIASAAALMLSGYKREYALFISIAAGIAVFLGLLKTVTSSVFSLRNIMNQAGIDVGYFMIVLKSLGICLITGFISDACRDAGQNTLASRAELVGRCAIFVISVPLLEQILNIALELIG